MPQWLLALHLENLHRELVDAVPGRRESYDKLLRAAQALHDQRRVYVGDELLRRLSAEFDALVGPEWSGRPAAQRLAKPLRLGALAPHPPHRTRRGAQQRAAAGVKARISEWFPRAASAPP